jgi:hypothetical protein
MAKYLKDILKAAHDQIKGVRPSEIGPLSTGKDPGVDYMPKAGDEADFIAKHSVQKWDEPYGNPNYSDKVGYTLDKEKHHGNTESKAKAANEEYDLDEAMSIKQKQHSNRVKTMPGKKGNVMTKSNFEAPFHKVHATVSKNGGSKEVVKHELQAKDKHDAVFNVQLMHHKAGHKIHDVKHKGIVKEEIDPGFSESKKAEDVSCNHTPAGTKCPMHEMADCTMSRTIKEGGMPASVIKSKQYRANMTDKEFADSHKDKSDADLRSMAWRHGHGKPGTPGHEHYVNRRNRGLKEEVEQIDELSTDLLHRAAHKAAKVAMTDVQGRSGPIFKKRAAQANKFRAKGMEQEKKERAMKEEALDEISNKLALSYAKSAEKSMDAAAAKGSAGHETFMKRNAGHKLALDKTNPEHKRLKAKVGTTDANAKDTAYKKAISEEVIDEVLTKSTTAGETIHDFVHSDNPKFKGKSKEKRKEMALAAYYAKQRNEEVEILEDAHEIAKKYKDYVTGGGTTETASRYKSHVNMLSKKTGQHPDAINKQVRKHVKAMNEAYAVEPLLGSTSGSHDIAKYKTDDTQDEIDMVRTELKAIANKTMHMLSNMPADHHIEPWIQSKIAAAKEMIGSVHDYMMYSDHEEDEQTDTPLTLPNMSVDVNTGQNV